MRALTSRALVAGGIVSVVFMGVPNEANACCVCNVEPAVSNSRQAIIQHVSQEHTATKERISEMERVLSDILNKFRNEASEDGWKTRRMVSSSIMYGARSTRDTLVALETSRAKRDTEATPGACATGDIPQSAFTASNTADSIARAEAQKLAEQVAANSRSSDKVVYGNLSGRATNYKSRGDFNSLWMGASDSLGAASAKTFNSAQLEDAREYVKGLFAGVRVPNGGSAEDKGKAINVLSKASIIMSAFTDEIGRKSAVDAVGRAVRSGSLKSVFESDAGKSLVNDSGDMSWTALLTADVDRRYMDPVWYSGVAGLSSPVSVSKEIAYMNATSLKVQLETLKVLRKIEMQTAVQSLIMMDGTGGGGPNKAAIEAFIK